jgi:hypothetical protein
VNLSRFQAFKLYPDETTADKLYNGIKFKDLVPILRISVTCRKVFRAAFILDFWTK